jgi:hypothetical protein
MGARRALLGFALLATVGVAPAAARLVDLVLAEIGSSPVTLSDVAVARALGVLGLAPSDGPVTEADLARFLDAQLALREAAHLAIAVSPADVDRAWEAAGGAALAARLDAAAIDPAWARRLIEADLRYERFIDLRFRAFAFVTDLDVDDALGPGTHDEAARARTRKRLEAELVAEAMKSWIEDARQRVALRRVPGTPSPWPAPFSLAAPRDRGRERSRDAAPPAPPKMQ